MPVALPSEDASSRGGQFTTTHWSVVLSAGRADSPVASAALERLCRTYWKPLYAYVRRNGHDEHQAQDLVQEFFARLLEKDYLSLADPARGRFRTFLLSSLKNFLVNEWKRANREKRGGGRHAVSLDAEEAESQYRYELTENLTPERLYERRWAMTLLAQVLSSLRSEYEDAGSVRLFDELKVYVWGAANTVSYVQMAAQLNMSEGAIKVAVHRLRQRFRETLRAEIANTAATPAEVDEELRYLLRVMSE